jgi:hypothetical protein
MQHVDEARYDASNLQERPRAHQRRHSEIAGWGSDSDMSMRPAVPKEHIPPRIEVPWRTPKNQELDREVLVSVEYPEMRPIFGTGVAPSGLSGMIRRAAFKRSENDIRHWLMLLFADRVNVVEGILEDFAEGRIPNIFAEMGWRAKFKYDTASAIAKSLAIGGIVAYIGYRITRGSVRSRRARR